MELPHLGKHCSEKSCHQLDFLPMKCDACEEVFCKDHVRYDLHKCQSSYKKNIQVPVCPLCNQPVQWKRGEAPDLAVGDHIDRDCQSDPAKEKRKVFGNKCSMKGCKKKEVVPIICDTCKMNYCLKHRHVTDHSCKGNNPIDRAREAALARASAGSSSTSKGSSSSSGSKSVGASKNPVASAPSRQPQVPRAFAAAAVQGNLSEDEALARALQASLEDQSATPLSPAQQQEEADRMLALSLQRGEQPRSTVTTNPAPSSNNCNLS